MSCENYVHDGWSVPNPRASSTCTLGRWRHVQRCASHRKSQSRIAQIMDVPDDIVKAVRQPVHRTEEEIENMPAPQSQEAIVEVAIMKMYLFVHTVDVAQVIARRSRSWIARKSRS